MNRRSVAALMAGLLLALYPARGKADDSDAVRTMLGLASLPGVAERDEYVGALPKGMLFVPQPAGLTLLGSVAGKQNGTTTIEVLYYQAPAGSLPDIAAYEQQLAGQGWTAWGPPGLPPMPFAIAAFRNQPRIFCKAGSPRISVHADHESLVVEASALPGICSTTNPGMNAARRAAPVSQAPYPRFSPPSGATFVGASLQTFSGQSHLASIPLVSTQSSGPLLIALAKQMSDVGWKPRGDAAADADSQSFTIRDANGVDWVAALTVVPVANGMYLFTVSAFKMSETTTQHAVSLR